MAPCITFLSLKLSEGLRQEDHKIQATLSQERKENNRRGIRSAGVPALLTYSYYTDGPVPGSDTRLARRSEETKTTPCSLGKTVITRA